VKNMLSLEAALEEILAAVIPLPPEAMPLEQAAGRVLAADVLSDIDMPPFDRSAVDGFALSGECAQYTLRGSISAGEAQPLSLLSGEAVYINTGASVPLGADRILMVEQSSKEGFSVKPLRVPRPGENICLRAEDVRSGEVVLAAGTQLTPQCCGIAAMAGAVSVEVLGRPAIAVLTTGAEVVPFSMRPGPSQIRNANKPLLDSLLQGCGFTVAASAHVLDELAESASAVTRLASGADALLVAGGISMGEKDIMAPALEAAGARFVFRDVAIKPGKPFAFGMLGRKAVFALPGNPVSVLCTFEELVLPGLRRMSGFREVRKARLQGNARFSHSQKPGRGGLLRVRAVPRPGGWDLELPASSGSGDLRSTRDTNALAIVQADTTSVQPGQQLAFSFYASSGCAPCFA
jgi:molybdopterin molybdotransferase